MPEISRERLAAKLQQIPEGAREPYLRQLKEKGYTWETRAAATEPSLAQSVLKFAREQGPTALGSEIGSTLGTPLGIPGRVAGATLGGAGGKAVGLVGDYLTGARDPAEDTASGNARAIGLAGLTEGATEAGMRGFGKWGKPVAQEVGAGLAKVAANVDEKYGLEAMKDPNILNRALPRKVVGQGYDAFERYTGLKGLERQLVEQGRATAPAGELERMVIGAGNKVAAGGPVDPQDLYTASQAASRLKLMAKYGDPQAAMAAPSGAVKQGKALAEKKLGETFPEEAVLRKQYFEAKTKEAFSPLLPKNKGGTTNVLRPALALREVLAAAAAQGARNTVAATGIGLPLVSPKAWGLLIRAFPALGNMGRAGARTGAAVAADELSQPEETP